MGTRSNTYILEAFGNDSTVGNIPIVNMYRQHDGYPSGHGLALLEFLLPITLVNGFGGEPEGLANGAGCLAAQMIGHFKKGVGGFYIQPSDDLRYENDFTYEVHVSDLSMEVKVYEDEKKIFHGTIPEYGTWINEQVRKEAAEWEITKARYEKERIARESAA
tara:strand:+ start:188 stop:673 length:486 start_codon:yes stop_codon:yes gene_type:complete